MIPQPTQPADDSDLLRRSPLDVLPNEDPEPPSPESETIHWLPSRYNIQATTEEEQLILWNTLSGAISMFTAEQRPTIRKMLRRGGFESQSDDLLEYLHTRGFLIKEGTDEFEAFQLAFGRQHYSKDFLNLTLLSSEDCNFRCTYCYESFSRGTMLPWVRSAVKKLLESQAGRLNHLNVSWFGGEPLYGLEAIEDIGPFIVDLAAEHGFKYWGHMSTNGFLLDAGTARKCLDWGVRSYQITLDGPAEDHNRNRPTRNGGPSFSTIFENLKSMQDFPDEFQINIRVNFDKANYCRVEGLIETLAEEFGGDDRYRIRFRPVGRWGGHNDEDLDVFLGDEATVKRFELQDKAISMGLQACDALEHRNYVGSEACYAARPSHLMIGATGKLMKCTVALDTESSNVLGSLTPDGDMDMDWAKFSAWTAPTFETSEKCKKCPLLPQCQRLSCPKKRLEFGKVPCIDLRRNAKRALLSMARSKAERAKRLEITRSP